MKVIHLVSALALSLMFSCNQVKEEKSNDADTETAKVIVVETPAAKVAVEKEKGTSIKIGPNGGSIKTENIEVEIDN